MSDARRGLHARGFEEARHNNVVEVARVADPDTFSLPARWSARVKREIEAGCARFWAKRGMVDPGGGARRPMTFGRARAAEIMREGENI